MKKPIATIGFSSHRAEALPFARSEMNRHQIIVLEEPPNPYLTAMLDDKLPIDDYLMEIDPGFPRFEYLMCKILREFHKKGHTILQIEPYLELLLKIHDLFAAGQTPEHVVKLPELKLVYQAEKRATGALIKYYSSTLESDFNQVIESVKNFACADAERLVLRSRLRAQAIASAAGSNKDMYIESGYIHYPLYLYMRRKLAPTHKLRVVFLLQPIIKSLKVKRRNMGPGDLLTLYYAFHSGLKENVADLLAARSLIYIKLIQKEEMLPGPSNAPHSEEDAVINRLVDGLDFEDCRKIFEKIRFEKRERALHLVKRFLEIKAKMRNLNVTD